ncbi:MAG: DUF4860 domain-containing protein [Clostridiales bacterium]|nr:DUF4860 domain-containing protein [Clostridiales bacterium]
MKTDKFAAKGTPADKAAKAGPQRAKQAGFSVIELLIALTLLALLGGSLLTVIGTGGDIFARIFAERDRQSEARIALSYVTVKLRQNGGAGVVGIVDSDSETNTRKVLKIDDTPDDATDDCWFIYFRQNGDGSGGQLVEKRSNTPGVNSGAGAAVIADVADFDVDYADDARRLIRISVGGGYETLIALRT